MILPSSDFTPDYRHIVDAACNRKPARLPLYEHIFSPEVMARILQTTFPDPATGNPTDIREFMRLYTDFFLRMTYDVVPFEFCITTILPETGALMGGKPGPIQSRRDFDQYPWQELPQRFWQQAQPCFDALHQAMPPGMKAIGGIGNGVFEISEDLVGLEYLAYMQLDDPTLFADLYQKIGALMETIWDRFLHDYGDDFCVCRFGDDLGFRSSTLTTPHNIRTHIMPQYRRVIDKVHQAGKPFLWHSCGCIFDVMDDAIACGIDAKHSNEDAIAPFDVWIDRYNDRIGLFGGIDVDILCTQKPDTVYDTVLKRASAYRDHARGYALGSGNSIPDYIPPEGYLALVNACQEIRRRETSP